MWFDYQQENQLNQKYKIRETVEPFLNCTYSLLFRRILIVAEQDV